MNENYSLTGSKEEILHGVNKTLGCGFLEAVYTMQ